MACRIGFAPSSSTTREDSPRPTARVKACPSVRDASSVLPAASDREMMGVVAVARKLKMKKEKLKIEAQMPRAASGAASGMRPTNRVSTTPRRGSIASAPSAGMEIARIRWFRV
eukprot:1547920-Rhodomonas_salina.3